MKFIFLITLLLSTEVFAGEVNLAIWLSSNLEYVEGFSRGHDYGRNVEERVTMSAQLLRELRNSKNHNQKISNLAVAYLREVGCQNIKISSLDYTLAGYVDVNIATTNCSDPKHSVDGLTIPKLMCENGNLVKIGLSSIDSLYAVTLSKDRLIRRQICKNF